MMVGMTVMMRMMMMVCMVLYYGWFGGLILEGGGFCDDYFK
jgi:hypothetical protein